MQRIWPVAAMVAVVLIWWLIFQVVVVGVVLAAIIAGVWIWWEIHALRKAMRTPPGA